MTKRWTSLSVAEAIAERSGAPLEVVKQILRSQAELAFENADGGFPILGIGVLALAKTKTRELKMNFGDKKGQTIVIPAKQRAKFRVSGFATGAILNHGAARPDIFDPSLLADFDFQNDFHKLRDPATFVTGFGLPWTDDAQQSPQKLIAYQLADLVVPSGRIVGCDPFLTGRPFARTVRPGSYPIAIMVAENNGDPRVAFAAVRFSQEPIARWEPAVFEGQQLEDPNTEHNGYGVDSGAGCFADALAHARLISAFETDPHFMNQLSAFGESNPDAFRSVCMQSPAGSVATFSSGYGDGTYLSYFGLDGSGHAAVLVTDFHVVEWDPLTDKD